MVLRKTWLEDKDGNKVSPNTLLNQIYNEDGTRFEDIFENTKQTMTEAMLEMHSQLNNKAGKDEIPSQLSDLNSDSNHRTVTDEQIENWNNGSGAEEDIKELKNPTFTEAETLANVESEESVSTLWGKIKKALSTLFSFGVIAEDEEEVEAAELRDADTLGGSVTAADVLNKMDKENPTGTGSMSMNRKNGSSIGVNSTTFGSGNVASGKDSIAMGIDSKATFYQSVAMGYGSESTRTAAVAAGSYCRANGNFSMALGSSSLAEGDNSIALAGGIAGGQNSVAIGSHSFAGGVNGGITIGSTPYILFDKYDVTRVYDSTQDTSTYFDVNRTGKVNGKIWHSALSASRGYMVYIKGRYYPVYNPGDAYVQVKNPLGIDFSDITEVTIYKCNGAKGNNSIVIGQGDTDTNNQIVLGKYNVLDSTKNFIIGNGTDDEHRKNALTFDADSNAAFGGDVVSGSGVSLDTLNSNLADVIANAWKITAKTYTDIPGSQLDNLVESGFYFINTLEADSTGKIGADAYSVLVMNNGNNVKQFLIGKWSYGNRIQLRHRNGTGQWSYIGALAFS